MALKVSDKAKGFNLPKCGGEASEAGYRLLVFYKVSCPTCQLTLPFIEKLFRSYGKRVFFAGISQDNCSDTLSFMEKYELSFPQFSDEPGYEVSLAFDVNTVPTIYLLDEENRVTFVEEGFVKSSMEELNSLLSRITGVPENPLFEDVSVPAFKAG